MVSVDAVASPLTYLNVLSSPRVLFYDLASELSFMTKLFNALHTRQVSFMSMIFKALFMRNFIIFCYLVVRNVVDSVKLGGGGSDSENDW